MKRLDAVIGHISASTIPSPVHRELPSPVTSLFLIRPGGIGNAVLLAPAINSLRKTYPAIHITVLAEQRNAGENYHLLYNEVYGIRACSLRLTNTYGPRHQMKHPRQGVLNWFVRQIVDGEKIRIFGSGSQIRDTNFVDDVVEAMLLVMVTDATNGEVYNIGGEAVSLEQFVETLIEVNGNGEYELVEFPGELKAIEIGDYRAAYSKFSATTGWKPTVKLREGLAKTLDYYRENGSHYWSRG